MCLNARHFPDPEPSWKSKARVKQYSLTKHSGFLVLDVQCGNPSRTSSAWPATYCSTARRRENAQSGPTYMCEENHNLSASLSLSYVKTKPCTIRPIPRPLLLPMQITRNTSEATTSVQRCVGRANLCLNAGTPATKTSARFPMACGKVPQQKSETTNM